MDTQTISITKARNEFFDLLMKSYNNESVFEVEKNGILMGVVVPPKIYHEEIKKKIKVKDEYEERLRFIKRLRKFRNSMPVTSNSVEIIRKLRNGQYYD